MALGEKLWEEKGKLIGISVRSVGPEGVTMEATYGSEVKGLGRFPSGRNLFSGTALRRSVSMANWRGILTTTDGEAVLLEGYSMSKLVEGRTKGVILWRFSTSSQKLSWMNGLIAMVDAEGPPDLSAFEGTGYEWK